MSAITIAVKGGTVAENLENWAGKVTLSGLLIVFAMLILLVVAIWLFGRIMQGSTSDSNKTAKKAAAPAVAPLASAVPFVAGDVEGETIAAISAAVMMMYEGTGKVPVIRSIRRADSGSFNAWRAAGIANNTRSF